MTVFDVKVDVAPAIAKLSAFEEQLDVYCGAAGQEAAEEVLETEGLRSYPAETAANKPPVPYYIRGRGMERAGGNDGRSEKYGSQWVTEAIPYGARTGNRASYAMYLAGEEQAGFMAVKGWRKLAEVAEEKRDKITRIFQGWIDKLVKDLGL